LCIYFSAKRERESRIHSIKCQFQWWVVSLVDAPPYGGKNVSVTMIRDLHSAMERENALIGIFITAALPTRPMETEAAAVGVMESPMTGRKHPRLQILTLAELFQGKRPDIPWVDASVLKSAKREDQTKQGKLL
jgi:hypothetical protein